MAQDRKHNHYFKDVNHLHYVDVYRVLALFNVTDPCIQHAVKKLLVAGGRGAGKDITRDIKEAIDSLNRWQEMRNEDGADMHPIAMPHSAPVQDASNLQDRKLNTTYHNTGTTTRAVSIALKEGLFIPVVNGNALAEPCSGYTFDVPVGGSYCAYSQSAGALLFGWSEQELTADASAEPIPGDFKTTFFPIKKEGGFAPWTNNGVTITHVPTGRTYSNGDPELSTHKNRDAAWKLACDDLGIGRDNLQP